MINECPLCNGPLYYAPDSDDSFRAVGCSSVFISDDKESWSHFSWLIDYYIFNFWLNDKLFFVGHPLHEEIKVFVNTKYNDIVFSSPELNSLNGYVQWIRDYENYHLFM